MADAPPARPVRVLIADGINNIISTVQRLSVFSDEVEPCGMARDSESLISETRRLQPDVVLLNPDMWAGDVQSASERLHEASPESRLIIVASGGAGAMTSPQLLRALRQVAPAQPAAHGPEPIPPLEPRRPRQLPPERGEVFLVFGGKGGVGKSMVAANLALALRLDGDRRVALVDLDLQFGDVALMLGIEESGVPGIEALAHHGDLLSQDMVRATLVRGPAGVQALLAPTSPGLAELVSPPALRAILRELSRSHDHIVIDGPALLDERTIEVIDIAEHIVLVSSFAVTAVKDTRIMIQLLQSLGVDRGRISIVLNQTRSNARLTRDEVEERLRMRVRSQLPFEPRIVDDSIDRGLPVVMGEPRSEMAHLLMQLGRFLSRSTDVVALPPAPSPEPAPATHPYRRRFGIGRPGRETQPPVPEPVGVRG